MYPVWRVKVEMSNPCYGGAHSLTLLTQLQQMSMGFNPDLVVVEAGVLDDYMPGFSQGAIESIMRHLIENRVAAVYLMPAFFQSSSTRFRTSGVILITSGQRRVKPSCGHFFVASTPILEP